MKTKATPRTISRTSAWLLGLAGLALFGRGRSSIDDRAPALAHDLIPFGEERVPARELLHHPHHAQVLGQVIYELRARLHDRFFRHAGDYTARGLLGEVA